MELAENLGLLIIGFILLIKGADYFVDGASMTATKLGIPQIVIGLTIVAFGTSAPEAAISISAALKGSTGIAIGNVVGSNSMNILLILGISALIIPLKVGITTVRYEIPFVIVISIILVLFGALSGELGLTAGVVFWALFVLFFLYLIYTSKKGTEDQYVGSELEATSIQEEDMESTKIKSWPFLILITILGLAAIIFGSDMTVNAAKFIATKIGFTDRVIGLTVVAFGTSLPELMTSTAAARKGNSDIAIGNIVGSNIFNILFVLGTTCLIKAVPYQKDFIIDGIVCIAAAVLLWLGVIKHKELRKGTGIIMLASYGVYFVYLLMK